MISVKIILRFSIDYFIQIIELLDGISAEFIHCIWPRYAYAIKYRFSFCSCKKIKCIGT